MIYKSKPKYINATQCGDTYIVDTPHSRVTICKEDFEAEFEPASESEQLWLSEEEDKAWDYLQKDKQV